MQNLIPNTGDLSLTAAELFRRRPVSLIAEILEQHRCVALTGPAGIGKTTLARQYAATTGMPVVWLAFGRDGAGLPDLLCAFLEACEDSLADVDRNRIEQELLDASRDQRAMIAILESALARLNANDDRLIVLDDVHHAEDAEDAGRFLTRLVEVLPEGCRCILASRLPMSRLGNELARRVPALGEDEIRFTTEEEHAFFRELHGIHLSPEQLKELDERVNGWALALSLLAAQGWGEEPSRIHLDADRAAERLFDQLLAGMPTRIHTWLYTIGMLEDFLPEELGTEDDFRDALESLRQKGVIQNSGMAGDAGTPLRLHPLFREYLLKWLPASLPEEKRRDCHLRAARCLERQGDLLGAAARFLDGGKAEKAARLVMQVGAQEIRRGRHEALAAVTRRLPEEILERMPWVRLLHETAENLSAPRHDAEPLRRLVARFAADGDRKGELLAIVELLRRNSEMGGRFDLETKKCVERAAALYEELKPELDAHIRARIGALLGVSSVFIQDLEYRGEDYLSEAAEAAGRLGLVNLLVYTRYFQIILKVRRDEFDEAMRYMDELCAWMMSPSLTSLNRMSIVCGMMVCLFVTGRSGWLRSTYEEYLPHLDGELVQSSLMGAYMLRYYARALMEEGELEAAAGLLRRVLRSEAAQRSPHVRGLLLEDTVLLELLQGKIGVQKRFRETSGLLAAQDRHACITHRIAAGAIRIRCRELEEALADLEEAARLAEADGKRFLLMSARLYLALAWHRMGEEEKRDACFAAFAEEISKSKRPHAYYWQNEFLRDLIEWASGVPEHAELADRFLREKWGETLVSGKIVPLLHIDLLGGLRLRQRGKTIASAEDFSPQQRELLTLLATQPTHSLPQSEIQSIFWPDQPAEKARNSFDAMLSRLRRTLNKLLVGGTHKDYLRLRNGILRLNACVIDADRFEALADQGLAHAERDEAWQAGMALREAVELYGGSYADGVESLYQVHDRRALLEEKYVASVLALSEQLEHQVRAAEARRLMQHAIGRCDHADALYRRLYAAYAEAGEHGRAARLLEQYRLVLRRSGLGSDAIQGSILEQQSDL